MRASIRLFALLIACTSNCIVFRDIEDAQIAVPSNGDAAAKDADGDASTDSPMADASGDSGCPVDPRSCPVTCAATGCVTVEQVAAGSRFACARLSDGSVRCWGFAYPKPAQVTGIERAVDIGVGVATACAVLSDGTARCWGGRHSGQLGDGSKVEDYVWTPVTVSGITNARRIALGAAHACALLADETVRCWGQNAYGQLGDGSTTERLVPSPPVALNEVVEVSAGHVHTCARLRSRKVFCWGNNDWGQLARTGGAQHTPVAWVDGTLALTVRAGGAATCAVLLDKTVSCTGQIEGGLGDGMTSKSSSPIRVSGLTDVTDVAGHWSHFCALAAGSVWCWGSNTYGQLGDGTVMNRPTPVRAAIEGALSIAIGNRYTLVVRANDVRGWGYNEDGALGTGTSTPAEPKPVPVAW
jgi:alpha-tubulin suppressor-like RCC1 family protein